MTRAVRPELYGRLKRKFGDVKIANEGEEALLAAPQFDFVRGRMVDSDLTSGEYYRTNCPFCTDTTYRLWINYRYGQQDSQGRTIKHLARCFNETLCLSQPGNMQRLYDEVFAFQPTANEVCFQTGNPVDDEEVGPPPVVTLPGRCVPIWEMDPRHQAVKYLLFEREYPLSLLRQYDVRVCVQAPDDLLRVQNWIILPVYMNGQIVGWQARFPGERNWKTCGFKKYYNLPNFKKSRVLYNFDEARTMPFIVLVEGMTGVWRMGAPTTACFGMPSGRQLRMLAETKKPICVFLDPGARKEAGEAVETLLGYGSPAFCAELPEGYDPGNASLELSYQTIAAAATLAKIPLTLR